MRLLSRLALLILMCASPPLLADVVVNGEGTHAVPDNCGFTVGAGIDGWIGVRLVNDAAGHRTDLWALQTYDYPLRAAEVTIFAYGPQTVTVHTSTTCGYTRSFNIEDQCEEDPDRPDLANPEKVPPGPDLPANLRVYSGGYQEVDFLSFTQTDWDYWQTARLRPGQQMWPDTGVRRCRNVSGYFLSAFGS
jgi:hypothetical protein